MKTEKLPVSVLIPTRDVYKILPGHLASVKTWAALVQEIVVVDSYSTDGTLELIQNELHHPQLRVLQHPPGLYQSWNYGIQQLTSKYTYISTIGDTITPEGLTHLVETAERFDADVVVSPPQLFDADENPMVGSRWPIHNLLEGASIKNPVKLEKPFAFLLAVRDLPGAILGSSASNLYRTEMVKKYPFPAEYGAAGDAAWAFLHAFDISLIVTPTPCARFLFHSRATISLQEKRDRIRRMSDVALQVACQASGKLSLDGVSEYQVLMQQLLVVQRELYETQWNYEQIRRECRPWIFYSLAWQARQQRNRQRQKYWDMMKEVLRMPICCDGMPSLSEKFFRKC